MTPVRWETAGEVAVLRFSNPILSTGALRAAITELEALPWSCSSVVVASDHPRIFLAGAHLGEIAALDALSAGAYARLGRRLMASLARLPVPVVAAVHGACAGGGLDLALACDWIVAAPHARLGHPGVRRGLVTGWGGTAFLPARTGRRRALALLAQGDMLTAQRAAEIGLVDDVTPAPLKTARRRALSLARLARERLELWRVARNGTAPGVARRLEPAHHR